MKYIFIIKPVSKDKSTKIEVPFPPGIFGLLVFTLVFLKLTTHQIDNWSWWFILSPVIVGTLISIYFFIRKNK
jgi:uncharacterized membrane protein